MRLPVVFSIFLTVFQAHMKKHEIGGISVPPGFSITVFCTIVFFMTWQLTAIILTLTLIFFCTTIHETHKVTKTQLNSLLMYLLAKISFSITQLASLESCIGCWNEKKWNCKIQITPQCITGRAVNCSFTVVSLFLDSYVLGGLIYLWFVLLLLWLKIKQFTKTHDLPVLKLK